MKRSPNYQLTLFADTAYLLPAGQLIADFRHGLTLNATAEIIWNELELSQSRDQLIRRLQQIYQILPSERDHFVSEIEEFLDSQLENGVILEETDTCARPFRSLSIAGKTILLQGNPEAFSDEFDNFYLSAGEPLNPDQIITVTELPSPDPLGTCILDHPFLTVHESPEDYQLFFPAAPQLNCCLLAKSGRNATFYVTPPYNEALRYDLFHGIRTAFLYYAERNGMVALHSASILYRDKAWLFSGPSGTGKSTHTNLWNRYLNTPVINGDLNLLACDENGSPVIKGMPWCGTSGICDNKTHSLGGVVLLKQDSTNQLYPLSDTQKLLYVQQRIISPRWNTELLGCVTGLVKQLVPEISVFRLGCTISREAVHTIQAAIDSLSSSQGTV